jgi:nucleoid-associated protein YgaU
VPATSPAEDAAPSATVAEARITVVDYGADGRLIVSGEGVPGATVRLYLSGAPIGEAPIGPDGAWTVRVAEGVDPGTYTLRADVLADDGAVVARAETPFRRDAAAEPPPPDRTQVVVQPGNSLWRIARSVYGQGLQYTVIYQANLDQIRNPDLIYPGQIFTLPAPPNALPTAPPGGTRG